MIHGAMIYAVGGFSILSAEARRSMLRGGWAPRGLSSGDGKEKDSQEDPVIGEAPRWWSKWGLPLQKRDLGILKMKILRSHP